MSRTTVLHLLTVIDAAALAAVAADRALGHAGPDPAVAQAAYALGTDREPRCDRLSAGADDRRRRGLPPTESAVEYPAIVEAMARAARVVSW